MAKGNRGGKGKGTVTITKEPPKKLKNEDVVKPNTEQDDDLVNYLNSPSVAHSPATAVANSNAQNYDKDENYQRNCQRCVWAYELQRRGYDVEAKPTFAGDDLPTQGKWRTLDKNYANNPSAILGSLWDRSRRNIKTEVAEAHDVMSGWGEGSRGIVRVAWNKRSGHVFNVEYKNGKITAYDAQTGKTKTLTQALKGTLRGYTQILRTDTADIDMTQVSRYVTRRTK